jgi:hypothetical protein
VVVGQHQVFHRFVGVFTELAVRQAVWRKADPGWAVCGLPAPSSTAASGVAHQYRRLDIDELPGVLGHYWHQFGIPFHPDDNNVHAVAAINRTTGGNSRLIERLMAQIARILEINQLDAITPDVVDAARQMLVVGTT